MRRPGLRFRTIFVQSVKQKRKKKSWGQTGSPDTQVASTVRATDRQSELQTAGESDVQEKASSITSVLQPGPQSAAVLFPPETQLLGWVFNSCISTVGPEPPSVPQTCWPARRHTRQGDAHSLTQTHTHTGFKVICIYLGTQARARQRSLLKLPKAPFH